MKRRMSAAGGVVGMTLFLGLLLAWGVVAEAAPVSSSQDPAQHSTAVVTFVKVDAALGIETLLFVNRQQKPGADSTTTSAAIVYKGFFYDFNCNIGKDIDLPLTVQDLAVLSVSSTAAGNFAAKVPGVVLFRLKDEFTSAAPKKSDSPYFAVSAVIIDPDFVAVYERQGSPLVEDAQGVPRWGGFSNQAYDDWYIHVGVFRTMLQFMCPHLSGALADLNEQGSPWQHGGFAYEFPLANVYNAAELFIRSTHDLPCFCNTDTFYFSGLDGSGDDPDYTQWDSLLADFTAGQFGTFHLEPDPDFDDGERRRSIGWRTLSVGPGIWWDGRLKTVPVDGVTTPDLN